MGANNPPRPLDAHAIRDFLTRRETVRDNVNMTEISLQPQIPAATPDPRTPLLDLDRTQLTDFVVSLGEPKFRAAQLWDWIYKRFAGDFEAMHNLPKSLRAKLAETARLDPLTPVTEIVSQDRDTLKTLFCLPDGQTIETVLMLYDKRRTLCISSQAGCAMGCTFCATAQGGLARNLSSGEILAQVLYFARYLADPDAAPPTNVERPTRVTNIVLMGMGEPLHNYDHTLAAVDRLTDPTGLDLGARKITISTVGLVPAIRRYADEKRQTPLAVSLHAATNLERDRLIPVNRRWPISELMDACRYYVEQTGRRMTFEWALIAGENDTEEQAHQLGQLLQGMLCHVNLIPLNPTAGYGGRPSLPAQVERFKETLASYGVSSTVRVRRGIDIQAGCGQLRDRVVKQEAADRDES